jgi:hypothetical protein
MEVPVIGSEAERAVLGAVMLDERAFRFVDDVIVPADFSAAQLEQVYAGIQQMVAARQPVDVITVGAALPGWGVRGLTAVDLHELISNTPHTAGAAHWAEQVRNASVRRRVQKTLVVAEQSITSPEAEPGEVLARTIENLREVQSGSVRDPLAAKTLAEILAMTDRYDWVIPGLLERKDRFILTGSEGAGKSTFVRQMAIASAAGLHPFTGERIDPVKVLIVDAENSEQQWRRSAERVVTTVRRLGAPVDPAQSVRLVCAPRLDITRDSHLGQIHRLLDRHDPDVLFIGPLYRLTPRAITNDDDAAPLLTALDTVRDRSVAMVMEAHAGHAVGVGGERDLRPRGSAALMGWPEFGKGIRLNRDEGNDIYDVVSWRGDREERNWPDKLRRGDYHRAELPWIPINL